MANSTARVAVLDADPELGASLPAHQWEIARRAAVAPLLVHDPGPWQLFPEPDQASLGILILRGLMAVRLELGDRAHVELLGDGDVISPWVGIGPELTVPRAVTAHALSNLRLVLLDGSFTAATARWPVIHAALMQRVIIRSRRLSLQAAINSLPRTDDRLLMTLWHLGYRFGRVTPGGLRLPVKLRHAQLAEMVAAQRPSVSVALAQLADQGCVTKRSDGTLMLTGSPPARFEALVDQAGV